MHILTYKYRLKGRRSVRQLRRFAYLTSQVWNYCVQIQKLVQRRYREGLNPKWISHFDLCYLTAGTSKELGISAKTIQAICKQFTESRDQHRKCPHFRKSSGPKKSLGWVPFTNQNRKLEGNTITYLGNTYSWFGSKSRPLPKIVKGGAFVEDSRGRWYVTFHVEVDSLEQAPDISVGIDLGLHTLATLSDGAKIENPRITRKYEVKLATARRAGNHKRAKAIHAKIKNSRLDYLHKASNTLASSYRQFFVGDVSSSKLARTNFSKSVHDASWYTFKNFLRYKASRHGGKFHEVNENFTTQTCSSCSQRPLGRPKGITGLGIRYWCCSLCGVSHDRDVNSALNILSIGLGTQPRFDESQAL